MGGIQVVMFLPLAICLLLCGALEARIATSGGCCGPTRRVLAVAACLRTILGVLALVVYGVSAPNTSLSSSASAFIKTSATYGQPSWTLALVCLVCLGVTSVLAAAVEIALLRSTKQGAEGPEGSQPGAA